MNKTKVEVYREVLRDISQIFEGAENFIKQPIEEICEKKKISVEKVFYFHIFLIYDVDLPFSSKIVVCYCYVNKILQSLTHFTKLTCKNMKQKLTTLPSILYLTL